MAMEFLFNRLKALFVFLLSIFRRALCCLRRRRRSSCDSIPLSAVGVIPNSVNNKVEQENWEQWDENPVVVVSNKPCNSVQSKIEQYRQQIAKVPEQNEETQVDFFQDMTPKITKQKKIILRDPKTEETSMNLSKFAIASERVPTNELETWDENATGWEEETTEEFGDPTEEIREQRRRERERRLYEQHQRRMDYNFRPPPLGEKISS
ncbi:receptor-binding cancer antigen expressed on SiSo cells [Microplitis demolitor]|uniref:receptor-binding cancer antigen expressed on SiSo cells n=1 Tax=Microplitis demolitor TaxID=69319 RepID=UPI0004CD2FBE|nr:receptor-binding cancer antigen expressed on SiSo cells [Microplitis demolitor]